MRTMTSVTSVRSVRMKREGRVLDAELETEDREARWMRLSARLRATVARAYSRAPGVRRALDAAGVLPAEVTSLDACHACR